MRARSSPAAAASRSEEHTSELQSLPTRRSSDLGSPLVSERLSKRVWQAIKQLNYFPNTHARTLVSGRSRLLGIIVENISNPFFPDLIQNFEKIAVAHGYEI